MQAVSLKGDSCGHGHPWAGGEVRRDQLGLGGPGPQPWFLCTVTRLPAALSHADPSITEEGAEVQRG